MTPDEERLEGLFPGLSDGAWAVTSQATEDYNCVAWAMRDTSAWWWPTGAVRLGGYYWPRGVPADGSIAGFIAAFESLGFEVSEADDRDPGFERLAVYADAHERVSHVARQLGDGTWTSKVGRLQDIRHQNPESLVGQAYGDIAV